MKSVVWETLALSSYVYALYFELCILDLPVEVMPMEKRIFGPFKKLTFWNLCIQTIYFSLALLVSLGFSQRTKRLRDFVFFSLALPQGLVVSIFFWIIFSINRELILPARVDPFFPPLINHLMHSTMLLFLPVQMLLVNHVFPRRLRFVFLAQITLCLSFSIWMEYIFAVAGFWAYPFLALMGTWQRRIFLTSVSIFIFLFSMAGRAVNKTIHGAKSD